MTYSDMQARRIAASTCFRCPDCGRKARVPFFGNVDNIQLGSWRCDHCIATDREKYIHLDITFWTGSSGTGWAQYSIPWAEYPLVRSLLERSWRTTRHSFSFIPHIEVGLLKQGKDTICLTRLDAFAVGPLFAFSLMRRLDRTYKRHLRDRLDIRCPICGGKVWTWHPGEFSCRKCSKRTLRSEW